MGVLITGVCRVRVRYSDTDAMAVAHHTRHLAWFEVGRTELMRATGSTYAGLEATGLGLPLIGAGVKYSSPARYDDLLDVETRVAKRSAVRLTFTYRITRMAGGKDVATGWTQHVLVDRRFRPVRFPRDLGALLDANRSYPAGQEPAC